MLYKKIDEINENLSGKIIVFDIENIEEFLKKEKKFNFYKDNVWILINKNKQNICSDNSFSYFPKAHIKNIRLNENDKLIFIYKDMESVLEEHPINNIIYLEK